MKGGKDLMGLLVRPINHIGQYQLFLKVKISTNFHEFSMNFNFSMKFRLFFGEFSNFFKGFQEKFTCKSSRYAKYYKCIFSN